MVPDLWLAVIAGFVSMSLSTLITEATSGQASLAGLVSVAPTITPNSGIETDPPGATPLMAADVVVLVRYAGT